MRIDRIIAACDLDAEGGNPTTCVPFDGEKVEQGGSGVRG
jgi:hypothetical protein